MSTIQAVLSVPNPSACAVHDPAQFAHMRDVANAMANYPMLPECFRLGVDRKPYSFLQVEAACLMVVDQAFRWGFDPYAVLPEIYFHAGRIGYSGKLVASLVNTRSGLKGRLNFSYDGEGDGRTICVSGTFAGEDTPRGVYLSVGAAKTENPMWETDPDQKLVYSGVLKWARRHAPEVVLGVLTTEDLETIAREKREDGGRLAPAPVAFPAPMTPEERDKEELRRYNAKLRAAGEPEHLMEAIPGEFTPPPAPGTRKPWRDYMIWEFAALKGKTLGEFDLPMLAALLERLERKGEFGRTHYAALFAALKEGLEEVDAATQAAEISDALAKDAAENEPATPTDGETKDEPLVPGASLSGSFGEQLVSAHKADVRNKRKRRNQRRKGARRAA